MFILSEISFAVSRSLLNQSESERRQHSTNLCSTSIEPIPHRLDHDNSVHVVDRPSNPALARRQHNYQRKPKLGRQPRNIWVPASCTSDSSSAAGGRPPPRRCPGGAGATVVLRASVTGPRCRCEGGRKRAPGSPWPPTSHHLSSMIHNVSGELNDQSGQHLCPADAEGKVDRYVDRRTGDAKMDANQDWRDVPECLWTTSYQAICRWIGS